jgi:hypothetical protein
LDLTVFELFVTAASQFNNGGESDSIKADTK